MPNRQTHQRGSRRKRALWFLVASSVVVFAGGGLGVGLFFALRSAPAQRPESSSAGCHLGAVASSCGVDVPAWSLIATLTGPTQAYSGPSTSTRSFSLQTAWPQAMSFPVIATAAGGWLEIRLIARPNGQTAWIESSSCTVTRTDYHLVLDLSEHQLLVFKLGRLESRAPAGTGGPDSPTPPGHYFLALFAQSPSAELGPFVIVTSAFADQETDWEQQGQPVIVISAPLDIQSAMGASGAAVTTGGIALTTPELERLRSVPAGTQLDVDAALVPTSNVAVQRIFGTDAVATAIAASHIAFPAYWSAKAVVLARSDSFADALAGGPLAAKVDGPLLTTPSASSSFGLDPSVQAEIQRVLAPGGTVYILGGTSALSNAIDETLQGLGYVTQRLAGSDEYATAVAVAQQLGNPPTIFETTGLAFGDAACAVPAAIEKGAAILLTDGPVQAPETASYLAAHPADVRYTIGGKFAASGADPRATSVFGRDAYATCVAVAKEFFPRAKTFGAATASSFPDALSGSTFMGTLAVKGPLLLVPRSGPLPDPTKGYLSDVSATVSQGYLFGGDSAVDEQVLSELESAGPRRGPPGHG